MEKIILNGKRMTGPVQAHEYLAQKLSFPEYYGKNLDALWDMLTGMSGVELVLKHSDSMLKQLQAYGAKLLQTLYEAAAENESLDFRVE